MSTSTNQTPGRGRYVKVVRIAGFLLMLAAATLCGFAIADEWGTIGPAIEHANVTLIVLAGVSGAAGMAELGVLWWRTLRSFQQRATLADAVAWYFGGELGKYIPGGIWSVLGRGELARRHGGISRATGYATTLISYAAMSVGAGISCGILAPFLLSYGDGLSWEWAVVAMIPLGVVAAHPAVLGRLLALGARATKGRVDLDAPTWPRMLSLIATSIPTWLLVGTSSVLVAEAFGFNERPARIMFAAIAAWIIGFLAVPVPAGAGLRELIFVALSGLGSGRAAAVAAGARLVLILVDGMGGLSGLGWVRFSKRNMTAVESPVPDGDDAENARGVRIVN